jgi:spermidine synthase
LRFLDRTALAALFQFPIDLHRIETDINRLDNQALVRYYDSEWRKWD